MKRMMVLCVILFVLPAFLTGAPVDPAWYDNPSPRKQGSRTMMEHRVGGSELYMGHMDLAPNTPLNKIASWRSSPQVWHKDVTMIVTSSHPRPA